MHIRDWPEAERPREKLLAHGAGALSDAELLAIFLGSGLPGRDAVQTARDLLARHQVRHRAPFSYLPYSCATCGTKQKSGQTEQMKI